MNTITIDFTKEQLTQLATEEVGFYTERLSLIPSQYVAMRLRLSEIALASLVAGPVYQLRDVDWYDTDERTYNTVVKTGGAGRIVYTNSQPAQVLSEIQAQGVDSAIHVIKTMMDNTAPAHHVTGLLIAHAARLRETGV